MAESETVKKRSGGKGAFILGLIIVCFAVVGAILLGNMGVQKLKSLTDDSADKKEYENFLYPVIMLDPDTFDDVTGADMDDMLVSSILSLLTDDGSNPYDYDFVEGQTSGLAIPQSKVDEAFVKLFGTEVKPAHHSVECSTCIFEYQSASNRYVIPITGYDPAYTPKVMDIKKSKEGTIELTVGYIAYGDWERNDGGDFSMPEPAKYRKITLRRSDSGYYVSSIQNADISKIVTNEISTSAPAPTQQTQSTAQSTTTAASKPSQSTKSDKTKATSAEN